MQLVTLKDITVRQFMFGVLIMPIFYSLITVGTTFIFKSSAGGITFSLGIMGIPALVKMFSGLIQKALLPICPQSAIHSLSGAVEKGSAESLGIITSICVLLVWISITCLVAIIKFQRQDI